MYGGALALVGILLLVSLSLTINSPGSEFEPARPLTAAFEQVPASHRGDSFSFLLRFSQPVTIDAESLRAHSFRVGSGFVTAVRAVEGRRDLWEVTIAPDARRSVRIGLLNTSDCGEPGAICARRDVRLSNQPEAVVVGAPISARFLDGPEHHTGAREVGVRLELSEPLFATSRMIRERALRVSGGSVIDLRRVEGRHDLWEMRVVADSSDDVTLRLNAGGGCATAGVGCLDDLHRIAGRAELTIPAAKLYLTFDDGPHPVHTPEILDVLARYGARGTFFVTGLATTAFPEIIERIVREGHTLGNHAWNHEALDLLTAEEFDETILRTQRALGEHATRCIRPPYWRVDEEVYERAARLGLRVVMGDVAPRDWARPGAEEIAGQIVAGAAHGAIIVLHDGGGERSQTVEAVGLALARLEGRRFSFEPVCR